MHFLGTKRTIKTRLGSLVAALLVLGVVACSDLPTGVDTTAGDLLGTWNITSLLFTPDGGGTPVEGVVGSATIVFRDNSTYTLTVVEGIQTDVEDGTFAVNGSTLTLSIEGEEDSDVLTVTALSSTQATLYSDDEEFDFNDDGEVTDATLTATLQKQ